MPERILLVPLLLPMVLEVKSRATDAPDGPHPTHVIKLANGNSQGELLICKTCRGQNIAKAEEALQIVCRGFELLDQAGWEAFFRIPLPQSELTLQFSEAVPNS